MDERPIWTDCDEAGDCVVPNVLSPRDLVSRPDNMDETVPHTPSSSVALQPGLCRTWSATQKTGIPMARLIEIRYDTIQAAK